MTRPNYFALCALFLALLASMPQSSAAQTPDQPRPPENLPSAPQPQLTQSPAGVVSSQAQASLVASFPRGVGLQTTSSIDPQTAQAAGAPGAPIRLTRTQAEQLALKNNPRISVGRLLGLVTTSDLSRPESSGTPQF